MRKMKRGAYTLEGERKEKTDLPRFFETKIRPDLIKRAVLSLQSKRRQPYGKSQWGDKKWVVEPRGKGFDSSRVSRTRGGMGTARVIPQAVGGRSVRAPLPEKKIIEHINKKEKLKAFKSALAATADPNLVLLRGHKAEDLPEVPIIIEDELEKVEKTASIVEVFEHLGLEADLERAKGASIRAGKGKRRGRKYERKKSFLIVVSGENDGITRAARNLPGVDVVPYDHLSVENLAPGTHPGRLTVFTETALQSLREKIEEETKRYREKNVEVKKIEAVSEEG